jgi:hypothetical protein
MSPNYVETSVSLIVQGFVLGFLCLSCLVAALFFLKFWRQTRDGLFLAFGIAFIIEGANRCFMLLLAHPSEGSPSVYIVRMFAALIILAAILRKNYASR